MKSLFYILILIFIFVGNSYSKASNSVFYSSLKDDVKVFSSINFKVDRISIATLRKGDVVRIVDVIETKLKIELKNGKIGYVFADDFIKLSDQKNSLMNEIEIISDLDQIEPIFLFSDDYKVGPNEKTKFIERSFMTEQFVVNLDINEIERLIRINKYKRR